VADKDLVAANALRGGVQELGTVLGPPLAGLLFAAAGARLVLGLDALTFLVAIPLVFRLPAPQDTAVRSRLSFARDARDGLAFIWRTRSILAIALGFWVVVLFSAPDDLILPFLATLTFRPARSPSACCSRRRRRACWPACRSPPGGQAARGERGHRGRVLRHGRG
jgi:hypothetical protein